MFKEQLLQHYQTEYNLLEAAQSVLKNWEERGDGSVDFRCIEILEAWCILSRASFEEMALEKLAIEAAMEADRMKSKEQDLPPLLTAEERSALVRKRLVDNLGKRKAKKPGNKKPGRKRENCMTCGTKLTGKQRKFCSHKCGVDHHNAKRRK